MTRYNKGFVFSKKNCIFLIHNFELICWKFANNFHTIVFFSGGPPSQDPNEQLRMLYPADIGHGAVVNKIGSVSNANESRRQFLSTLAPLTACVSMGGAHNEDYYYHISNNHPGEFLLPFIYNLQFSAPFYLLQVNAYLWQAPEQNTASKTSTKVWKMLMMIAKELLRMC